MTAAFRILLLAAALAALWFVLRNIRRSALRIAGCLYWLFLAALFVLLACFPELTFWAAGLLGIQSPVNLVFLVIIAVMLWRQFTQSLQIASLELQLRALTQELALREKAEADSSETDVAAKGDEKQ